MEVLRYQIKWVSGSDKGLIEEREEEFENIEDLEIWARVVNSDNTSDYHIIDTIQ